MVTYHFLHESEHWKLPAEQFDRQTQTQIQTRYHKMRETDRAEINDLWTQLSSASRDIRNPTIAEQYEPTPTNHYRLTL